ncbi:hypothetical protein BDA99DRAFT_556526 [Phascolomyces articulosus]|uniref:Uncharacterized protein n=1 Tax=Phascolomyces articulosus TaxID=60185 RepID=A0AAD5K820_9FUNG|nr:hypothetical protein BDA99DRAFT_556526 [Phascolomyces articulosus]
MTEVKAQSSRMEFLFQASHVVFASCPELSRFYMSEFQQCLRQQDLVPAKSITRSCCPRCGQIYVPGLNTQFQGSTFPIPKADLSSSSSSSDTTHTAAMTTMTSNTAATHINTLSLFNQPGQKQKQKQQQQQQPQQKGSLHQQQQHPAGIDKKKKKNNKGGKKNHLQAMLASRQQSKEAEKKGSGGLGLNDFLSSL